MKKKLLVALALLTLGTQVQAGKTGSFFGGLGTGLFISEVTRPRQTVVIEKNASNRDLERALRKANRTIDKLDRQNEKLENKIEDLEDTINDLKDTIKKLKDENKKTRRAR